MLFKKSIPQLIAEANENGEHTLKRTLSSSGLIALGVGAIIGAGLFSLTGI
ncbi:MAG TPA: amino acid transporter, partial [Sphingobacterium sp.]|nr:amino acid transporter [Sphingobacterium sp.]